MPTKKTLLPRKELVWYIIAATIATVGLVFLVFGIIGSHLPVKASDNWVKTSENAWLVNWSKMGYRWWGLILIGVGLLIGITALCFFARSGDRDSERAQRRAQRLAIEGEEDPVEVEVEPKAEEPEPVPEESEPEEPVEEPKEEKKPEPEVTPATEADPTAPQIHDGMFKDSGIVGISNRK